MSRDLPWMSFHVADYVSDTLHLTTIQHGAYLLLIMHYWKHGKLPENERQLTSIAKMTAAEWEEHRETLAELFLPRWKHKRVEEELTRGREKYAKRAGAGKKGGEAKAAKQTPSNATPVPLANGKPGSTNNILPSEGQKDTKPETLSSSPEPPFSQSEIDRMQIAFESENIREVLPDLWEWAGRKGAQRDSDRKAMIWKALENRRGSSELIEAKQNAPPVAVSRDVASSRLARAGRH